MSCFFIRSSSFEALVSACLAFSCEDSAHKRGKRDSLISCCFDNAVLMCVLVCISGVGSVAVCLWLVLTMMQDTQMWEGGKGKKS